MITRIHPFTLIAIVSLLALTSFKIKDAEKKSENNTKAFISKLGKPKKESGLKRDGYFIWGSSVIKGDDGKYHMFTSCWPKNDPMSSWITKSTILHSISDTPEGPFKMIGEAIPPRGEGYWDGSCTHNPSIHKHKDTYILFYMGSFHTDTGNKAKNEYEGLANKRIGLATSKSLYGPWTRYDTPIIEPRKGSWDAIMTSNPAPYVEEDGSVLLIYKSWTRHATEYYANKKPGEVNQLLGVARADHYLGEYKRIKEDRIFSEYPVPFNSEDPYIWKQDGKYHLLAKIFEVGEELIGEANGGYHATSEDGIKWTIDTNGLAWSRTLSWVEGGSETYQRVERPQLLIQNGKPTHIYFACRYFDKKKESHSICIPFKD